MENNEERIKQGEDILHRLLGARLTSVQFVLNYLILGFDAKGALTTLVWPTLIISGDQLVFGDTGYRDALCELISAKVHRVEIASDETIIVVFDNDAKLEIPLQSYALPGERAIFTAPKHEIYTW